MFDDFCIRAADWGVFLDENTGLEVNFETPPKLRSIFFVESTTGVKAIDLARIADFGVFLAAQIRTDIEFSGLDIDTLFGIDRLAIDRAREVVFGVFFPLNVSLDDLRTEPPNSVSIFFIDTTDGINGLTEDLALFFPKLIILLEGLTEDNL